MINFLNLFLSKFRNNPQKIKHYFLCYLKNERAFSLDLFYLLKKGALFSSNEKIIAYSRFFCRSEYYIYLIKNKNLHQKQRNKFFDKILKKKIRIHSSHFLNEYFLEYLWNFLKEHNDPIKTSDQLLTEDNRLSGLFLIAKFLSLKGLELPSSVVDSGTKLSGIIPTKYIDEIAKTIMIKPPVNFSFKDPACFETAEGAQHSIELSKVCYHVVSEVNIYSGAQIIQNQNLIIYEKSADPRERTFIAGLHGKVQGLTNRSQAAINFYYEKEIQIEKAALIATRCSTNYFHWMIEYLPKIKILADANLIDFPILVEKNLPTQHIEALNILAKNLKLAVIYYDPQHRLSGKKLLVTSPTTYHPDDPEVPFWQGAGLQIDYLQFLKENLIVSHASMTQVKSEKRNIFLTRPSHSRGIVNIKDLYKIASKYGFEIITPEKLSIEEQIALFKNINILISPCGSALVNALFMPMNSNVISLIAEHNKTYAIYSNLCKIFNVNYTHLTGEVPQDRSSFNSDLEYVHAPFKICTEKFSRLLEEIIYDKKST